LYYQWPREYFDTFVYYAGMKQYVILHNIRSAHNVGSVFRSSDGAGVTKIFLTGYTPAPKDRFGRENAEIKKTSLGATETVPYEVVSDVGVLIERLKQEGVEVVAVEQTPTSISYKTFTVTKDTAFIFGNEVTGVEKEILDVSDVHIELPMAGSKESLNVSVCAGIVLFYYR
jgi:23S rRNA (guanosine2251-2'-O)-methyltransferase